MSTVLSGAMSSTPEALEAHRGLVWGLCYRMTGVAADADELVQDTFIRALQSPPRGALRPWLMRVATNLSRDRLRRRRHAAYTGPWLPAPIDLERVAAPTEAADARYESWESVSFAFLVALEALTPTARAVLLLRDVFDYSTRETAELLNVQVGSVRTTLHRARKRMAGYDADRDGLESPDPMHLAVLARWMMALASGDVGAAAELLADDVVSLSDGGDEFYAAKVPIVGPVRVARMYLKLGQLFDPAAASVRVAVLNGAPAVVLEMPPTVPGYAPRGVTAIRVGRDGRIDRVWSVLATPKLTAVV